KTDSDIEKENDELRLCLTIASDEDKEVNYEIIDKKYPIIEWNFEYHGIKPQFDETKYLEEININVVIRSNGQRIYFSTLMRVLSIFDRLDFIELGDLRIMFEETADDDIWKNQEKWIIKKRRYPLIRETLERMMGLRLTAESEGEAIFDLIRFIQKQIDE
ncbi:hypothetical protein Tco_0176045, partial [Tanacetum coccineum]